MRSVTYSMNTSLDGFVADPNGAIDWSDPDQDVFRHFTDELRQTGVHLLGRRLYETMLYWETAEGDDSLTAAELEWAGLWKALPKVVFSRTLTTVRGTNTRLASGTLAEEIEHLRAEPGDGDVAIGGATLAAEAAASDLIDEYRAVVHPVLLGGGTPYFPGDERRVKLELVEAHTFASGVVRLRHRVIR